MKTKEELNALKEEVETVSRKLHELTDEELAQVSGGAMTVIIHNMEVTNYKVFKEKTSNAVNDTNIEVDRNAIQKEISASIQQIDDNALLTFNGKILNNGQRTCK